MVRNRPAGPSLLPWLVVSLAAAALSWTGLLPTWPGLLQLVALPPLDLVGDLRLLAALSPSYPIFLAGAALSLVARTGLLALTLRLRGRTIRAVVLLYAVSLVPAAVSGAFAFTAAAALYHVPFWIGMGVGLLAAVTLTPRFLRLSGAPRTRGPGHSSGLVVGYVLALGVLGWISEELGEVGPPLLLPVSALMTHRTAGLLTSPRRARWSAGGWALAGVAALVVAATIRPAEPLRPRLGTRLGSLFLVGGVDTATGWGTMFEFRPEWLGYSCRQTFYYSYRGPGRGAPKGGSACPVTTGAPYRRRDTQRAFPELVRGFSEQVSQLEPPVVVLTHSQGEWIAWEALARGGGRGVDSLVMVGPFPDHPVSYPSPRRNGRGRVGADALRLITAASASTGFSTVDPDSPLARQLLAPPGGLAAIHRRPLPPSIRVLSLTSGLDLPLIPRPDGDLSAVEACPQPVHHGTLPLDARAHVIINRFLDGRALSDCPLAHRAIGLLPRVFTVPPAADRGGTTVGHVDRPGTRK